MEERPIRDSIKIVAMRYAPTSMKIALQFPALFIELAPEKAGSVAHSRALSSVDSRPRKSRISALFTECSELPSSVVRGGEAEVGPAATVWRTSKFLGPDTDGTVLPNHDLNGYKVSNPTIFAQIPTEGSVQLLLNYGQQPCCVSSQESYLVHEATFDQGVQPQQVLEVKQREARPYIKKHGQDLPEMPNWKWSQV